MKKLALPAAAGKCQQKPFSLPFAKRKGRAPGGEACSKTCLSVLDLITRKSTVLTFYCIFKGICLSLSLPRLSALLWATSDTKASLPCRRGRPADWQSPADGNASGDGQLPTALPARQPWEAWVSAYPPPSNPGCNEADAWTVCLGTLQVFCQMRSSAAWGKAAGAGVGWRRGCSPAWVCRGPQPGRWGELVVSCLGAGEAVARHTETSMLVLPASRWVDLTFQVVLSPTVIHWLQMIVIVHWRSQCSGGAHVMPLIFQEHHSCSQSVGMNYGSDGNGGSYKELGVISAIHLMQEWFQCTGKDWGSQEQVAALPCCTVGYTGACWSSGAECCAPWDKELTASHLNSVFSAAQAILNSRVSASFGIMLHLYSDTAPVVWHIRTVFPIAWFPEEGNMGAWAGRELPCTPAGTLLCSAGLRCKQGWRLPSSKAQTSSIVRALNECNMQFSKPCILANLGLHFLRIPKVIWPTPPMCHDES